MIIEEAGIINSNKPIASNLWQLELKAPLIAGKVVGPGQFIEILIDESWEHPLRRPMSITAVDGDAISIIYKTFGCSTEKLSKKIPGDKISVLGPLGNTFTKPEEPGTSLLVAGGVGIPPILWLKRELSKIGAQSILIIGARTGDEHFTSHSPQDNIYLTTDDGSKGVQGTVMTVLDEIVPGLDGAMIYTCGPEAMLKAVQDFSLSKGIPAQLSAESYMACGVGLCQGCAVPRDVKSSKMHSYHNAYSLVCLDGPVYSAGELKF